MTQSERRNYILSQLALSGKIFVNDIALSTGASTETIRRDIASLDEQGILKKVHGGAEKLSSVFQAAFSVRMQTNIQAKNCIGQAVADLIEDGSSVFIDFGSTSYAFAQSLSKFSALTVITNSHIIAEAVFRANSNIKIFLLGGIFSGENNQNIGSHVVNNIMNFKADYAVIGASGVSINGGICCAYLEEAEIAKAMLQNADKSIVICDNSKIGARAFYKIANIKDIKHIITNDLNVNILKEYNELGVNVISVNSNYPKES